MGMWVITIEITDQVRLTLCDLGAVFIDTGGTRAVFELYKHKEINNTNKKQYKEEMNLG